MVISSNGTSNTISINTSSISVNVSFLTLNSDTNKNYDYNIDNNYITFKNIEYITKRSLNIQSIQLSLKSENNTFNSEKIKLSNSQIKNNFIISYPTFNFTSSLSGSFTDVQLETIFKDNENQNLIHSSIDPFSKLDITSIKSGFDFETATIQNNKSNFNPNIFYTKNNPNIFSYSNIIKGINYEYNNTTIKCSKNSKGYIHIKGNNSETLFSINPPSTIPINLFSTFTQQLIFSDDIYNKSDKANTGEKKSNPYDFFSEYFNSNVKYEPKFLNINSTNYQYDIDRSYITILDNEITGFIIPKDYNYSISAEYINNNNSVKANEPTNITINDNTLFIKMFIFSIGNNSPTGVNASIKISIKYSNKVGVNNTKSYDIIADKLTFNQLDQSIFSIIPGLKAYDGSAEKVGGWSNGFGFHKAIITNTSKTDIAKPTVSYKKDENIFNYIDIIDNIIYKYNSIKSLYPCTNDNKGGYKGIEVYENTYLVNNILYNGEPVQIEFGVYNVFQTITFKGITNKGISTNDTPITIKCFNDTNLYASYINQFNPKSIELTIKSGLQLDDINYDRYMSKANQKIQINEIKYNNITKDMNYYYFYISEGSATIYYIDENGNGNPYLIYNYTKSDIDVINSKDDTYIDENRIFSTFASNSNGFSLTNLPYTKFYLESQFTYHNKYATKGAGGSRMKPHIKDKTIKSNKSENFMKLLYYDYTFDFDKANIINTVKHTDPDPDILIPEITVKSENNKENLFNTYICQSYNSSIRQLLVKTIKYTYNYQSNYVYTKNNSNESWKYIKSTDSTDSTDSSSYIIGKGECT